MSALGQKQTSARVRVMSALPPKADIPQQGLECHPKDETKSCDDRVGVECPTSAVANANLSAERQPAMGGGHCRTLAVLRSRSCGRTVRHFRHRCSLLAHAQWRPKITAQTQPYGYNKPAPSMRPPPVHLPRRIESRSLNQKRVWHKLDQQRSEIRQANEAVELQ